jgi:hypothetical protein
MDEIKCQGCLDVFEDTEKTREDLDDSGWDCPECGGAVIFWPEWVGSKGLEMIIEERKRQVEEEGWRTEHDAEHDDGSIAWAAVCYAAPGPVYREKHVLRGIFFRDPWPWDQRWDKRRTVHGDGALTTDQAKRTRIRELTKAGALIAAEIDRIHTELGAS